MISTRRSLWNPPVMMMALWSALTPHGLTAATSPDEAYLDDLRGRWVMQGTLGVKPVRYDANGERALGSAWLKLRMVDVSNPPRYEAEVWFGFDAKNGDYIVHWLDKYGAGGARVVASGRRNGERLVFLFPYAEGAFRDTLDRDKRTGSWTLLIEGQDKQGKWSTFANYKLTRPAGQ